MRRIHPTTLVVTLSTILAVAPGCSEEKKPVAAAPSAAPTPTPAPAPPPPPRPAKPVRPEKIDMAVTADKRAKAEGKVPEARGFLVASELEEKLKANKKLKEKEAAVTAFDKLASGKWILFAGPVANLTASSFDIGITYTPQIPGDMIGMSRQWFPVTLSSVTGYVMEDLKPGQVVVVLAKYGGKQKAAGGTELVAAGSW